MTIKVKARNVGQNFCTVGQVWVDGRLFATTDPLPYGFEAAALSAAADIVERRIGPLAANRVRQEIEFAA